MQFFIGITLSGEIKEKILSFQKNFFNSSVYKGVEPHITVKSQGGLAEDKSWLPKIESAIKGFKKFNVSFEGVDSFGEDVVFLKIVFSQDLINLHKALLYAVGPYEDPTNKYFENERYCPHLTLGKMNRGLTKEELAEMKACAQKELRDLPAFEINSIRIYQENTEDKSWKKLLDIPLGA